jgi:hypothetical protein
MRTSRTRSSADGPPIAAIARSRTSSGGFEGDGGRRGGERRESGKRERREAKRAGHRLLLSTVDKRYEIRASGFRLRTRTIAPGGVHSCPREKQERANVETLNAEVSGPLRPFDAPHFEFLA